MGRAEQAQDGAEVHVGSECPCFFIQPSGETHGPAFDNPACEAPGEVRVVRRVAAVAEGDKIRELVGASHRSRKKMMDVGVA